MLKQMIQLWHRDHFKILIPAWVRAASNIRQGFAEPIMGTTTILDEP
jgi:hypothetical protein